MTSDKRADARTTTLKYVSQLLESADALFRHETAESIAEATQLYLQARDLLGAKPASGVPSDTEAGYRAALTDRLDKIRNSRSIDGIQRVRTNLDPPIDPTVLVRGRDLPDPPP